MYKIELQHSNAEKAIAFGKALDRNDQNLVKKQLTQDVAYYNLDHGKERGPDAVTDILFNSRRAIGLTLDHCEWEQSYIRPISETIILVHFSCKMRKGHQFYHHHCTQRLYFNDSGQINMIDLIDEPVEQRALLTFLESTAQQRA